MIEGLSDKPPRHEVAMQLDDIMKNLVQLRIEEKEAQAEGQGGDQDGGQVEGQD